MRLLIITTEKDFSCYRIVDEAGKKGVKVFKVLYKNLKKLNFEKFDFCILRDPYNTGRDYSDKLRKILNSFESSQILDYKTYKEYPNYEDKLFQHKLFKNIKMPEIYSLKDTKFPCIVKKKISSRGKEIFILNSEKELENFFSKYKINDYLIEEFLDVKEDIRVFLIKDKIIGIVNKKVRFKKNRGYKGIGVKILNKYKISDSIKKKAVLVSKIIKCDFCGIDFLIDKKGEEYLSECNISPQFNASEKILRINIAGKLIESFLK